MGSVVKGVGHAVGGVVGGAKDLLSGDPIKALKDVAGGVVHGALDVLGNPLLAFLMGGPIGLLLSGMAARLDQQMDVDEMQGAMREQARQMQKQMAPYSAAHGAGYH